MTTKDIAVDGFLSHLVERLNPTDTVKLSAEYLAPGVDDTELKLRNDEVDCTCVGQMDPDEYADSGANLLTVTYSIWR